MMKTRLAASLGGGKHFKGIDRNGRNDRLFASFINICLFSGRQKPAPQNSLQEYCHLVCILQGSFWDLQLPPFFFEIA